MRVLQQARGAWRAASARRAIIARMAALAHRHHGAHRASSRAPAGGNGAAARRDINLAIAASPAARLSSNVVASRRS